MSKVKYRPESLSKDNIERLEMINKIIEEYKADGYVLTLRQLYYQLVSRDIIPNTIKEYKKLSILLVEGRMCGVVDWAAIEDRTRSAEKPSSWGDPSEILDSAIYSYARPRQEGQENYIEVWVEKDALSGVLSRVTSPYHIPIMVNRGYSSASAMHEAFKRFQEAHSNGQAIRILYLGDHDPSGLDMINDVKARILEFFFGVWYTQGKRNKKIAPELFAGILQEEHNLNFDIIPIALTKEQIRLHKPPPNPAKMQDPRAGDYVAQHGKKSWEVDALKPEILNSLLEEGIAEYMDRGQYENMVESEAADKERLRSLLPVLEGEAQVVAIKRPKKKATRKTPKKAVRKPRKRGKK